MPVVMDKTVRERAVRNITFQIVKNKSTIVESFTLPVGPEELIHDETARAEVTKTLGGAYIEEWGMDLPNVSLRGTTGYKKKVDGGGHETDGYQAMKEFRNDVYRYFIEPDGKIRQYLKDIYEMFYYNWEDGDYYRIQPLKFTLSRSKSRPLLYMYDFPFICLYPVAKPRQVPTVMDDTSSFEYIATTGMAIILTMTDILRRLLVGDNLDGSLMPSEIINNINYPGIANHYDDILEIVDFAEKTAYSLRAIINSTATKMTVSITEIKSMQTKIRNKNISLNTLHPVPNEITARLQVIATQIGALVQFENEDYFAL
jgi:hypothetical protein